MKPRRLVASIVLATSLFFGLILLPLRTGQSSIVAAGFASEETPQPSDTFIILENVGYHVPNLPSDVNTSPGAPQAAFPMYEGFIAPWPLPATGWQVTGEPNTANIWGRRSCHPRTPGYSMWSHGGGSQGSSLPCLTNYPNSMESYAVYGPVNLSNASKPKLTFYIYGRTEIDSNCQNDYFMAMSSTNGTQFSGYQACGDFTNGSDINGYRKITLDLSDRAGLSQVWIMFGFVSNSSQTDIGVFVDDIAFENDTATPTPTDTPTPNPGGYTISGVVRDPYGFPAADVNVAAIPMGSGGNKVTQTGPNGAYVLSVIAGTYIVQAAKTGYYATHIYNVSVPPSRANVDLNLGVLPGCPTLTPEPFHVEPVTSPTSQLSQVVTVRIGNGEAVTITTVSGVFTSTGRFGFSDPAQITVNLLPNTTHDLTVQVRTAKINGCGGYTLTMPVDKNGKSLQIVHRFDLPPTLTPTATQTPTPSPTPTPSHEQHLPAVFNQISMSTTPLSSATPTLMPPTPVASPTHTPTPSPTLTPPPSSTLQPPNRRPEFRVPFGSSMRTEYRYDNSARLIGATTRIYIDSAFDPDGDPLTYSWTATNGSIEGIYTSGIWERVISSGRVQPGRVYVTVSDSQGGSVSVELVFN